MKAVFLLIVMLMSINSHAGSYRRFVEVNCLDEARFLEIREVAITNNYFLDGISEEQLKAIYRKSNLIYGKKIRKTCILGNYKYEIEINYSSRSSRGRCMGNPGGSLTLKRNGDLIIDKVYFNWSCDWPDIKHVTVQNNTYITVCGIDYSRGDKFGDSFCLKHTRYDSDVINSERIKNEINSK